MHEAYESARYAATTDDPVLILGETGVGKTRLARAIHDAGARKRRPFVDFDCRRYEGALIANDLFGHTRSAYTGADRASVGMVGESDGGTLFLDEIGVLSIDAQTLLLRLLDDGSYRPIGATRALEVDCRIIAATNLDVPQAVEDGGFRRDVAERLSGVVIGIPPLRERSEDILRLAREILSWEDSARRYVLTPSAEQLLLDHPWSGNVRELAQVLGQASGRTESCRIGADLLDRILRKGEDLRSLTLASAREQCDRQAVARALSAHRGCVTEAAKSLDVSRATLNRLLAKLGIDATAFRSTD